MARRTLTPKAAALIEDAHWIARWGGGLSEAAARLGYTRDSLNRLLAHFGQTDLIDRLKRQDYADLAKVDHLALHTGSPASKRANARKDARRKAQRAQHAAQQLSA